MTQFKVIKTNLSAKQTTYRISTKRCKPICETFNIGDYVKNIDDIIGKIIGKNESHIIVQWDDDTKERIKLEHLKDNYLHYINIEDAKHHSKILNNDIAVDNIKEDNIKEDNIKEDNIKNDAITDNENDDNNSLETQQAILKKRIADLEEQLSNKEINKIKTHSATELVSLAIEKGMIDEEDRELEILRVSSYTEEDYKAYEEQVMSFSINGDVSSLNEQSVDTSGMSKEEIEAHNMLTKMKFERGITNQRQIFEENAERRSPKEIGERNQITFSNINNITKPASLEEALLNISEFSDNNDSNSSLPEKNIHTASLQDNIDDSDKSAFLHMPIQGITKPLMLGQTKAAFQAPSNSDYQTLLSELDWTTFGR